MSPQGELEAILGRCERLYADLSLESVKAWKRAHPGRPAIGHLPVYVPKEIIHAVGGLPVAVLGGGDQVDIIKGDACFQSYICHIPRSTVELGLQGELSSLDGVIFPSTCDVIRNLSGIWQMLFPKTYVRFLDLPQTFGEETGGYFYKEDLESTIEDLVGLGGTRPTQESWAATLRAYNDNRRAIAELYALRAEAPWLAPVDECFLVVRAGATLEVSEHTALVKAYTAAARKRDRRQEDRSRVVMIGSFCEQPPLGLLRTLERSGCYVVDDDLNLGARWIQGDVDPQGGVEALSRAYLHQSTWASTRYEADTSRGQLLAKRAKQLNADGVIFSAPSFCDPALFDQPPLQKSLSEAGLPYISFKYAENTGQFQGIREQAGTFSDSIKLWGTP